MHARQSKRSVSAAVQIFLIALVSVSSAGTPSSEGAELDSNPRPLARNEAVRRNTLRVDVRMNLIPVTVTDAADHPVTDLPPQCFRIFEDDVEQTILSVHKEDGSVSVGFLVDLSGSMAGKMRASIAAIQQFMNALVPGDEYYVLGFNDRTALLGEFTEDPHDILAPLSAVQPEGWTALNDAIYFGVQRMKRSRNTRRAVIVLTDGGNNHSRYSDSEVRVLAQESDVRIYSVGLIQHRQFLERLAINSGGRAFCVRNLGELPGAIEQLSLSLRNTYVIGYTPSAQPRDGRYHRVRVELAQTAVRTPLNLVWRRGYYAPLN